MPAKKSNKKTPLSSQKKAGIDITLVIMVAAIAIAGLAFVVYASAATADSLLR